MKPLTILLLLPLAATGLRAADTETSTAPIPFSEIGAKATADYQGDAIGIRATREGAELRTGFQKLAGTVTREGFRLKSTAEDGGGLRLVACAVGRAAESATLPLNGDVMVGEKLVSFTRPGLTEEYSVSVDGVRQDFIVTERPAGMGELRVALALSGARAEAAAEGVKLILEKSGRELAYSRLHVVDATGRELAAKLEVLSADCLAVKVADTNAAYPIRIDPTFSDADWVSLNPGIPGTDGTVYAAVVDGDENLYIGGAFTFVGTVAANHIAKWDGSVWSTLGRGTSEDVEALAVSGTDLYVGGKFTAAGDVSANHVAKWNGSAWSCLGTGVYSDNQAQNVTVRALAISGTHLYVAGYFATAGGVANSAGLAKWDGSNWSALGAGMASNVTVYALAVVGTDLYAGGYFTMAGGVAANRIAKWDGTNWSALGAGMNESVLALAVVGTDLYVGGGFTTAGGVAASCIAKWDGSDWSALGAGINNGVSALAVVGTDLYAGGYFTMAGGVAASRIAKWDGSNWSALGAGMDYNVSALAVVGTDLYAGGQFATAGGVAAKGIAKWNGSAWSALVAGMNESVHALAVAGTDLYAGGFFTTAGSVVANYIAKWDGSDWSALGAGMNTGVRALAVVGTDLYAGGNFTTAGGVATSGIAKWNGSNWSALGAGINGGISALAVDGTALYAGGYFTTAGGVAANHIAKWDGTNWSALGAGMNSSVSALAVAGTDLYAGGNFTTAGGAAAKYIAKWDGSNWTALGAGINGGVFALAVDGTDLYAGGSFSTAGGVAANHIAKWNGTNWSALGAGMDANYPSVLALAVVGTDLYAGGNFTTAGGVATNKIAKWDGTNWSALGTGMSMNRANVNYGVNVLAVDASNHLILGGSFLLAGSTVSPYLAQANLSGTLPTVSTPTFAIVSGTGARLGGDVTKQGSDAITARGVVVATTATNANPQIGGIGVINVSGPGSPGVFTVDVGGLTPATAYTYAAYATNGVGTSYTTTDGFMTLSEFSPDIAVEQPVGTSILSGGSVVFPVATSTTPASLTFTIKNPGVGDLDSLAVSINGPGAAHFTVTENPAALVISGSTTSFTVRLKPPVGTGFLSGPSAAALHVSNNVAGKSPYNINLSGTVLSPASDTDADGSSDAWEYDMSELGFNWQASQPALVTTYNANVNAAGYYSVSQLQSLKPAAPMIARDPASGKFTLTMDWKKSTDLTNFSDFPAPAGSAVSINPSGDIEFEFTSPAPAAFFRIEME